MPQVAARNILPKVRWVVATTLSLLHLHNVEQHDGNTPGFWMKVTGVFGGDATKRQVILGT